MSGDPVRDGHVRVTMFPDDSLSMPNRSVPRWIPDPSVSGPAAPIPSPASDNENFDFKLYVGHDGNTGAKLSTTNNSTVANDSAAANSTAANNATAANHNNTVASSHTDSAATTGRTLPDRESVTEATIEDAYVQFILYCNPAVPLSVDTSTLRAELHKVPRHGEQQFGIFSVCEKVRCYERDASMAFSSVPKGLGAKSPGVTESKQKHQQYAARLTSWMRCMRVIPFVKFLEGIPHEYYTRIPSASTPFEEQIRDSVGVADDKALQALLPELKPPRDRHLSGSGPSVPKSGRRHGPKAVTSAYTRGDCTSGSRKRRGRPPKPRSHSSASLQQSDDNLSHLAAAIPMQRFASEGSVTQYPSPPLTQATYASGQAMVSPFQGTVSPFQERVSPNQAMALPYQSMPQTPVSQYNAMSTQHGPDLTTGFVPQDPSGMAPSLTYDCNGNQWMCPTDAAAFHAPHAIAAQPLPAQTTADEIREMEEILQSAISSGNWQDPDNRTGSLYSSNEALAPSRAEWEPNMWQMPTRPTGQGFEPPPPAPTANTYGSTALQEWRAMIIDTQYALH